MALALSHTPGANRKAQARLALRLYVQTGLQKEAAYQMGVSHDYVRTLLSELYAELGAVSALDAMARLGWVSLPSEDDET